MHSSRMHTACCNGHFSSHTHPLSCIPPAMHVPPAMQAPPAMHTPPCHAHPRPVNRITDACENITLPQLRCGR